MVVDLEQGGKSRGSVIAILDDSPLAAPVAQSRRSKIVGSLERERERMMGRDSTFALSRAHP